jgi:hypothetical protein
MLMGHTRLPCVRGTAGGTCVWKHIQCGEGLICREGERVSLSAKLAVRPAQAAQPPEESLRVEWYTSQWCIRAGSSVCALGRC